MSETTTENGQVAVEEPQAYVLPTPLAIALLSYLAKQPYEQVHGLITAMQAMQAEAE